MGLDNVYCAICGAPMLEDSRDNPWLTDAILLTTAHWTEQVQVVDEYLAPKICQRKYSYYLGPHPPPADRRTVLRLGATADGPNFHPDDSEHGPSTIIPMHVDMPVTLGTPDHGAPLYLPVHRLCLELADRFMDSLSTSLHSSQVMNPAGITSPMQLWEVLHRRLRATSYGRDSYVPSPQDYHGGHVYRNCYYDPGDDFSRLHEQNPCPIDPLALTESLLHLTPIDDSSAPSLSQDWHFEALHNGQVFPWLWDLDMKVLREHQASGHWDWAGLTRLLAQQGIQDPLDTTMNLPAQLRNRRRIWSLLSEAWVGDVSQQGEEIMVARREGEEMVRELDRHGVELRRRAEQDRQNNLP